MQILDEVIINQYRDVLGAEVFNQSVNLYVEQSDIYLKQLNSAVTQKDYQQWQSGCHILKSASGNTGLKQVFTLVSNIEYSKDSFTELAKQLSQLEQLNNHSIEVLKKWLAQC